ncbi:MAG: polysaccharide deacetylase family protein [Thermoanaerobaculia bacterium]
MRVRYVRPLILGFAALAPLAMIALWSSSVPMAIGVLAASHALVLYPTLRARSQWLGRVVTSFRTTDRELWLTIDDGPDPGDTDAMLHLLNERGVKATFFVIGTKAARHPELVGRILENGHTIGNHSLTHPAGSFWCLGSGAMRREIEEANRTLAGITGVPPSLFRAPVGMKNPFVHPLLHRLGMDLVGWSARGYDGISRPDPATVATRIERELRPGAIILLHQGRHARDGRLLSVECVEEVVIRALARGYRFIIPERETFLPS